MLIALGVWSLSSSQANKARIEKDRVEFSVNAARARLLKTGSERHIIEDNLKAWQALEKRGFTNDNKRLSWLEAVTEANKGNQLYGLEYTLSPPIPATLDAARGLPLMQTTLHIKMPMLVEGDLTRFLDDLKDHPSGIMRTKTCTISRSGPQHPAMINRPGLEAECDLLWYTLKTAP
jgi:hypothetical protein